MPEPNTPGQPGTGQPGGTPPIPGTDDTENKYLSKEEFGRTAAVISGLQKTLKELPGQLLTLDRLAEVGLLEKVDVDGVPTFRPKSSQAPKPEGEKKRTDDDPLMQRVKTLEGQLAQKTKAEEETKTQLAESEKRTALTAALTKAGAVNADRDYVHLSSKVVKGEKGFGGRGEDKYGTEIDLTIDEVAEAFLTANPELKKATAQPGSGTPTGGTAGFNGAGTGKVIAKSQWSDTNWFMANRAKFHSGEYVRGQ